MKKSLLIASALLLAASASAFNPVPVRHDQVLKENARNIMRPGMDTQKAPVKNGPTADGYEIQFCGNIYSWYYAVQQNKVAYQCFIFINPEIATALAGNKLNEITFSAALTAATQTRTGEVFVHEVDGEGNIDFESGVTQAVTVIDSNEASENGYQVATIETPYEIKANTGFIFGYTVKGCAYSSFSGKADYPIGVDAGPAGSFAGLVYVYDKNDEMLGYLDMEQTGCNLFLKANTVGSKKGVEDVFGVQGAMLDAFTLPIMVNGEEVTAYIGLDNYGSNALSTLKYSATVAGGATLSKTVDINVPAGESKLVSVPMPDLGVGRNDVNLTIEAINNVPVNAGIDMPYISLDNEGYARKFVVEEGTGDWCGFCPRGIVGFEYMEQNYPEAFTGIAVHCNDDMQADSYMSVASYFFSSFPTSVINRDALWADTDPNEEDLEYAYNYWKGQRSPVKVDVKAVYNEETKAIDATAVTEFALSERGADYGVAFVLMQDNVPGAQTNYYAGGNYGECGGWESKSSPAAWFYNHVARDLSETVDVPASITKGEKYTVECSLPTTNVTEIADVTGIDKTTVVALVIDNLTGTVLNAAEVKAEKYGTDGVKDAMGAASAVRVAKGSIEISGDYRNAAVYNAAGAQVAAFCGNSVKVPAGMYIVRVDGVSHKVIVK